MKLSVVSSALSSLGLDETLAYLSKLGVEQLELGVGGYPGTAHADAKVLIKDAKKREELLAAFKKHGMEISVLAVHGNCVHPDPKVAAKFEEDFEAACVLAGQIGVDTIVTFSGCPGSDPDAKQPSWVTCVWPNEYLAELEYQWNEVLIPYWKKAAAFAGEHGVKRIALEMHPGFCVYNPESCMRLRSAVGDIIGANLDPSHLIWQGMDIVEVIRYLGDAIYHFHAKDTYIDEGNMRKNGALSVTPYAEGGKRSWSFRTVGYGTGELAWKKIISALKVAGYDGSISIEHEDSLMSRSEGLEKAVAFLKDKIIRQKSDEMWWV